MSSRPPYPAGTAIALPTDHHEVGPFQGEVDGHLPPPFNHDYTGEQTVKQPNHFVERGPNVLPQPHRTLRQGCRSLGRAWNQGHRLTQTGGGERDDCACRPLARQVSKGLACGLLTLHEDGRQSLAGSSLKCGLAPLVDVDELDERAQNPVHLGQPTGTGARSSFVQSLSKGFGPGRPAVAIGVC